MHSMGKTIARLHAMLKLPEKGLPKKTKTSIVLGIRGGKIQKDKKNPQGAKGKDKGKTNLAYAPNSMISWPPKRENLAKDSICHHCEEVGHCRRNNPAYHINLKKKKVTSVASTSDPESNKWVDAMNVEVQTMKDNQVWCLVDLPSNGRTVRRRRTFQ
nr:zinc finger, CCHC-type [Tanacetum cinerariifolium]